MTKKTLSTVKLLIIAVVAVIVGLVAAGGIYCVATDQSPASAVSSAFSKQDKLIGKWQSQSSPGLSAYVFYEDGSYDSYISTVNFSGDYTVKGNKLTLINPKTNATVTYKFKVKGKVLTLTLIEDGKATEENKYDSVDELQQKTLADLIGDATNKTTAQAK